MFKTNLNFDGFSQLENLSPLNTEMLIEKSLLVVEKLYFAQLEILF